MSQLEDYDPAAEYMDLQELAAELSRTQPNSANCQLLLIQHLQLQILLLLQFELLLL